MPYKYQDNPKTKGTAFSWWLGACRKPGEGAPPRWGSPCRSAPLAGPWPCSVGRSIAPSSAPATKRYAARPPVASGSLGLFAPPSASLRVPCRRRGPPVAAFRRGLRYVSLAGSAPPLALAAPARPSASLAAGPPLGPWCAARCPLVPAAPPRPRAVRLGGLCSYSVFSDCFLRASKRL